MSTQHQSSPASASSRAREKSAAMRAASTKQHKRRQLLTQLGVIAVTAAIVLGIALLVLTERDNAGAPAAAPDGVSANGSVVVGNEDADVTITLVEDFGCPACGAFEVAAGPLLEEYAAGEDVKIEYRAIALLDRAFSDNYPSRAANASAVVATEAPEAWAEFHALLFANQPSEGGVGLTDEQLIDLAVQAGADREAVADDIADNRYADWVSDATDTTLDLEGVEGTPTVFVDGEVVESTPVAIQQAVDAALGR